MSKHQDPTLELIAEAFRGPSDSPDADAKRVLAACTKMFSHSAFKNELAPFSPHDREEIQNDFAAKLYSKREQLREVAAQGPRALFFYCLRCLHNFVIDCLRTARSDLVDLSSLSSEALGALAMSDNACAAFTELISCVELAIQRMPEPQRTAVALAVLQRESRAQIAAIIGKTPGNTRVILHRGIVELRRTLAPFEPK